MKNQVPQTTATKDFPDLSSGNPWLGSRKLAGAANACGKGTLVNQIWKRKSTCFWNDDDDDVDDVDDDEHEQLSWCWWFKVVVLVLIMFVPSQNGDS
jgi:hypothetical protein